MISKRIIRDALGSEEIADAQLALCAHVSNLEKEESNC